MDKETKKRMMYKASIMELLFGVFDPKSCLALGHLSDLAHLVTSGRIADLGPAAGNHGVEMKIQGPTSFRAGW